MKEKSRGGSRFLSLCLSCFVVVWRLDRAWLFLLSSFAFFFFDFPSLSVGALCFFNEQFMCNVSFLGFLCSSRALRCCGKNGLSYVGCPDEATGREKND